MNVSKSEFATRCGVTAARVSQWISEGKIDGDAIVGEGRSAVIDADLATAQLKQRLDPAQRRALDEEGIDLQMQKERLAQTKLKTDRMKEIDREQRGVYVLASDARGEMLRIASTMQAEHESWLPNAASAVAAKFQIPQRDVLCVLKENFLSFRASSSAKHAAAAAKEPEVHDETEEDDPT